MKTNNLPLLVTGILLILSGGQVPYLAVDLGLREALWQTAILQPLIPWIKFGFPVLVLVPVLVLASRIRFPLSLKGKTRHVLLILFLVYSFVPFSMNSAVLTLSMGVSLCGFLLAAVAWSRLDSESTWVRIPVQAWAWVRRLPPIPWMVGIFLSGLCLNLLISWFVFSFRPCIIDTIDQVFQARIYLSGNLTAPAPPVPRAFDFLYMIIRDGRWYSHYPPGNPVLLIFGLLMGASWIVGPLLGALLPLLLYGVARDIWGERSGRAVGLVALASPYLHLMSGSHMSHTPCAFFLTLGVWALIRLLRGGGYGVALLAGIGFGYAVCTRPYTALAVSVAAGIGLAWAIRNGSRLRFRTLPIAVLMAAVPVCLLLLYNLKTNGHALIFGYNITQGPLHKLGFGVRKMNEVMREFTLWEAVKQTGYHLNGLNVFALGTAIPGILLCPWAFLAGRRHPYDWVLLLLGVAPLTAFFFYPFTDFVLGPRLVFSALPFGLLLTGRSLIRMKRVSPRAGRLVSFPPLVLLLFLPALSNLAGAMSFNQRFFRPAYERIRETLAGHDLENALVLCDSRVFDQYGFAQLRPDLPAHLPVFARDINSAELVRKFPGRSVFRLAFDDSDHLRFESHEEPVLDLYERVANHHTSVLCNQGMSTRILEFHAANSPGFMRRFLGETHAVLFGFKTPAWVQFNLALPTRAYLRFSSIVFPESWLRGSDGITFQIRVKTADMEKPAVLFSRHVGRTNAPLGLLDQEIDLRAYAGAGVLLWVEALPGPEGNASGDIFDISNLRIVRRDVP